MHIYNEPPKTLSSREFEQLSEFIRDHCGIKMPVPKKIMLESRLQKRLRVLGISSFQEYCDLLFNSPDGAGELVNMIDSVTTNKTDFFREPAHFSFLAETVLPEFKNTSDQRTEKKFTVWSAGCATGEEPYTLAIVLSEFAAFYPGFLFAIVGTDLSTKALEKARLGIYDRNQAAMIPPALLQKYFMRSKDKDKGTVRDRPRAAFFGPIPAAKPHGCAFHAVRRSRRCSFLSQRYHIFRAQNTASAVASSVPIPENRGIPLSGAL